MHQLPHQPALMEGLWAPEQLSQKQRKATRGGSQRHGRGEAELNHFMGWIAGPLLLQIIVFHVLLFLFGLFA